MITNYFKKKIMGEIFNITGQSGGVQNFYIGLSTSNPNTSVSEPTGGNYSRVNFASSQMSMSQTNGDISNSSDVLFNESSGDWGTITHWVLFDSETGGNLLAYGQIYGQNAPSPRTVEAGTVVKIKSGALLFSLSDT